MNLPLKKGISFGTTSGVITTLGMMVGLYSSTHSPLVVISGIIAIAVADALSDALGIHISEEAEGEFSHRDVWKATIATFLTKFIIALTFIIPILIFNLNLAIAVSVLWGIFLILLLNYFIARIQQVNPLKVIAEHLLIAVLVILITYYLGNWLAGWS